MEEQDTLLTARQIWAGKRIYWITSYKALLKYISKDYTDILKPIIKGNDSGKRYYVKEENIKKFVEMFETNKLSK